MVLPDLLIESEAFVADIFGIQKESYLETTIWRHRVCTIWHLPPEAAFTLAKLKAESMYHTRQQQHRNVSSSQILESGDELQKYTHLQGSKHAICPGRVS